jgi:hypothetical protein
MRFITTAAIFPPAWLGVRWREDRHACHGSCVNAIASFDTDDLAAKGPLKAAQAKVSSKKADKCPVA